MVALVHKHIIEVLHNEQSMVYLFRNPSKLSAPNYLQNHTVEDPHRGSGGLGLWDWVPRCLDNTLLNKQKSTIRDIGKSPRN